MSYSSRKLALAAGWLFVITLSTAISARILFDPVRIVVGVGIGLIPGYVMYRSGLVPRRMAMLGLIGGPLVFSTGATTPEPTPPPLTHAVA